MAELDEKSMGFRGDRVREHTEREINREIDERQIQADVRRGIHESPETIERQVERLDREWDVERMLEWNASSLILLGLLLAGTRSRRWLVFPAVVSAFLLEHALQGWCPPAALLRRLGFRTQREIEAEKYALKSLQKMRTSGSPA